MGTQRFNDEPVNKEKDEDEMVVLQE